MPFIPVTQKIKHSTILLGILLFALAVRLPVLFVAHTENDEIIYNTLTNQVLKNPLNYTLRGTNLLSKLPPEVYDYPVFRHPPLFVAMLAVSFFLFGKYMAVFVPSLFAVLTIAVVCILLRAGFILKLMD